MACSGDDLTALIDSLGSEEAATLLCDKLGAIAGGLDTQFLIWAGALVFIMHAGFAMLCAGAIRSKNTMNILLQTILDACVSALAFWLVGYGFAYGYGDEGSKGKAGEDNVSGFIGDALFGMARFPTRDGLWHMWFYQWAFAATAATIPAGCVAERFNFNAYLAYSAFIAAWVYPVVVHWAWSSTGWMSGFRTHDKLLGVGFLDFAGSGVVHMVGAFTGLTACALVGPRLGRFDSSGNPVDMPGHSATLVVLGTTLLWFGWYGFNPGSALIVTIPSAARVAARCAVTTTLSGAAGGFSALLYTFFNRKAWDLVAVCNGVLVGFVSITAGCAVLQPWAAVMSGAIGVLIFEAGCALLLKLHIDDPLSAAPMHGFCGMWALIMVGLLAHDDFVIEAYGVDNRRGLLYGGEGAGKLLACQIIGILVILGWTVVNVFPLFFALKHFGKLRISAEEEQAGLDVSKHGGSAYNTDHGLGKPTQAPVHHEKPVNHTNNIEMTTA